MSDQQSTDQGPSGTDDRARRARALRALAQQRGSHQDGASHAPPVPTPVPQPHHAARTRPRRWMVIGVALLLVAIVVAVTAYLRSPGQTAPRAQQRVVSMQPDLQCERDVAWSPDSGRIAVIGYERACPSDSVLSYNYQAGVVAIYAVHSGQRLARFAPDALIAAALHLARPAVATPVPNPPGDTAQQVIEYSQIAWSPDGTQLALPFAVEVITAYAPNHGEQVTSLCGLLLTSALGAPHQVLSHALAPGEAYSGEWNVMTHQYLPTRVPKSNLSVGNWQVSVSLGTPALTYTWGPDGALLPGQPLTASGPPSSRPPVAPIGQPIGGRSFTIWQPGQFATQFGSAGQGSAPELPGTYTLTSTMVVWSPDQQYVLTAFAQNWRVQPLGQPAPLAQGLEDAGLALAPVLPARDAAFAAVLERAPTTDPRSTASGGGLMAWSPDGRWLAVRLTSDAQRVSVYACATGKRLVTLTAPPGDANGSGTDSLLRWAPDGTHLLLFDAATAAVTIWGQDQLPAG